MNENSTVVEQRRLSAHGEGSATGMPPLSRHPLRSMIAAAFLLIVVLLIVVLANITGYLEKWLWMRQLDYIGIFWTVLSVQWAMLGAEPNHISATLV